MSVERTLLQDQLQLRLPVIQGPFGGGLSSVELVTTVCAHGGLGSYGAHVLPAERIGPLVSELRAHTAQAFAINLWLSDHDPGGRGLDEAAFDAAWQVYAPWFAELGLDRPAPPTLFHPDIASQLDALLEARPPVFSFVFGVPDRAIQQACRARGIYTIGTATTPAEAEALAAVGVDAIVATGMEAGGHRVAFLAPAESALMGTFALTQLVSRRVSQPVIAAGGIADARGVRAALLLGAQAAQIGTAFLACEESAAHPLHRALLFSDANHDTTLTRAFTGRLARGIRNRWTEYWRTRTNELPPFPVASWFMSQLRTAALARGDTELVALWCGQIAPNLEHRSAAALMQALDTELQAVSPAANPRPHSPTVQGVTP